MLVSKINLELSFLVNLMDVCVVNSCVSSLNVWYSSQIKPSGSRVCFFFFFWRGVGGGRH